VHRDRFDGFAVFSARRRTRHRERDQELSMTDRSSIPPGEESLRLATERQRASNVRLAATLGEQAVSDELRLVVVHEIHAEKRGSGGSTCVALERYEDKVRGRLGR
jgi:hypothetical protein